MSNHPIAMEGKLSVDGRFIEVGALQWGPGPIPVVMSGAYDMVPLGRAEGLMRHPDGTITADIILPDERWPNMHFSIYTTNVEYHLDHNIMYFTSGLIRSIIIVDYWPWATHKE